MASKRRYWNCAGEYASAKSCAGPAILQCGSCGATSYCSRRHQTAHWKEHRHECSRMAQQMARANDILDFPFSFTTEATKLVENGESTSCLFMEKRELHLKGLWRGECECVDTNSVSAIHPAEWQLPSSMSPCTDPPTAASEPLNSWKDYFRWRQLPLDSPVALLLHWPLTLYHSFGLVSSQLTSQAEGFKTGIHVHYLGPDKELRILHVFAELMALLPNMHIHIDMIGPAIPATRDGEVVVLVDYPECLDPECDCKHRKERRILNFPDKVKSKDLFPGVTLKLWRGLYHDRYQDLNCAPHFVMAPNAGIAAFQSWRPTIELLNILKVPAIFTDYCEEAAHLAAQVLAQDRPKLLTHPVQVNPFRQPFSPPDKILNLPTFSNCFSFGIN